MSEKRKSQQQTFKTSFPIPAERQVVFVFTSPTEVQTLGADGILDAGGLLPVFSCRVQDLFEAD